MFLLIYNALIDLFRFDKYIICAFGIDAQHHCLCIIDLQACFPLRSVSYLSRPALCATVGPDHLRNLRLLKML